MLVYHGSDHIIEKPVYHGSKRTNDYGYGFYTTESIELAKESSLLFCFPIFLLGSLFKAFHRFQVCFFHRGKGLNLKFAVFRLGLGQCLLVAHAVSAG